MTPTFLRVARNHRESGDVVTLEIPLDQAQSHLAFKPGQFNMLYAFGVGEVPISMSGDPADTDRLVHTIRAAGPSRAVPSSSDAASPSNPRDERSSASSRRGRAS